MKCLIVGLGSMGKRRIRNLLALGIDDITGFDLKAARRKEASDKYNITTIDSIESVCQNSFDVMFVSVPPDKHTECAYIALENNMHCFIEASIMADGLSDLENKAIGRNLKFYASATLRFHPTMKKIKEMMDSGVIGKVSNFSYHSGQYLPDWHPWEDIKDFYVSRKETGGCREIVPFELAWLNWIFGDVDEVAGFRDKTISLDADIDDTYAQILKYKSGTIGTLIVDVVSRSAVRNLIVNGEIGQLRWDWNEKVLKHYCAKEKKWFHYNEPKGNSESGYNENIVEEMYIEEVKTFLDSIREDKLVANSLTDDLEILNCLYAIEKSNDLNCIAKVEGNKHHE